MLGCMGIYSDKRQNTEAKLSLLPHVSILKQRHQIRWSKECVSLTSSGKMWARGIHATIRLLYDQTSIEAWMMSYFLLWPKVIIIKP